MELLRAITVVCVAGTGLLAGAGARAQSPCPDEAFERAHTFRKSCRGAMRIQVACDGDYPELEPGTPLCCSLDPDRAVSWFCDGDENMTRCPTDSVRLVVRAEGEDLLLACFRDKLEAEPDPEEDPEAAPEP